MKKLKPWLRIVIFIIAIPLLYVVGVIMYGSLTEYKPAPGQTDVLEIKNKGLASAEMDSVLHFMIWNLGYGGLGREEDFFFDGGKTVRAPREIWDKDFRGQYSTITGTDSVDFFLLQEIDICSKRSYEINQYDSLASMLKTYTAAFAVNYDVNFVPKPYLHPFGKVNSGVATFSKYQPASAERIQYPGHFGWPTKIFFLDRCFLIEKYPLKNGKELVVINTHNSAYDESGEIKKQEMEFLRDRLTAEYEKGNYVIAGGDWNQCPPGFNIHTFQTAEYDAFIPPAMEFGLLPDGWIWCYDPTTPTNRHLDTPLDDNTFKTLIDFYVISPNIKVKKVKTINNGFDFSDHQPVLLTIELVN